MSPEATRARWRSYKRRWRAANPEKKRAENARRVYAGATYLCMARDAEEHALIQTWVNRSLAEFRARQAEAYREFSEGLRA